MSSELSEVYERLEAIEASKAPARAAVILAGLGFTPEMQKAVTKYEHHVAYFFLLYWLISILEEK